MFQVDDLKEGSGKVRGRFAPSPSGRMHLGNVLTALISWLSVKSKGGDWVLRIEDLDPQRSKREFAKLIEDDLSWLGLDWDEGGLDNVGEFKPYSQSHRGELYQRALARLKETGLLYPCFCTRADIMATQAPHQSDGRIVYSGRCRPATGESGDFSTERAHAVRIMVPDEILTFEDRVFGLQKGRLDEVCGDFVLRRADGEWAYQLAVVVDDALMGITEVVRGNDLILSTLQQIYLFSLLGYDVPEYAHLPLLCNSEGRRLAKRDKAFNLEELRSAKTPREIVGQLAFLAGVIDENAPCTPMELIDQFDWRKIRRAPSLTVG